MVDHVSPGVFDLLGWLGVSPITAYTATASDGSTTRDLCNPAELERIKQTGTVLLLEGASEILFSVEHPARLHDEFVAKNAEMGIALLEGIDLGGGWFRVVYRLGIRPPRVIPQ